MKRSGKYRWLYFTVGGVILALIGVQLYWMWTGVRMQQLAAERSLKNDLEKVIKDVEEKAYCFFYYSKAFIKKGEGIYIVKQAQKKGRFLSPAEEGGYLDTLSMYNLFYFKKDTFFDRSNTIPFDYPATVDISLKFKFAVPSEHIKRIDTNSYKLPFNADAEAFQKALNNSQTLDGLINPDNLDSLIKATLNKNTFDTVYEMGIKRVGSNDYEFLKKGSKPAHLQKGMIKMSFLGDNFNKPYELFLYLPDPTGRTIRSMAWVMICSIAVIIVLIISFAYFVKTILNQKKLSEMKSMFINNITHEFNTPITNINLAVENWRNAKTNQEFYTSIIEEENKHLQKNVEQMLQLSAMEHTKIGTSIDKLDINRLICDTINSFEIQLERVKGTVEYNLMPDVWMYGDARLVRDLIYNLVDNAIKYSRTPAKITLSTYEAGNKAVIEIEDNGIGMSSETMKYMFERFYRGDKSDRHDIKGFGIGLSYVQYIVDAHKGNIQVKSKKGEGTKFTVSFPKKLNGTS
ncbi:MAG: two-component sensor histidine kinase [Flavipsychrobacter sp.]|jgi:signal transduction histidine kinase|nr:two-component sensor histidine kinase [Flavipsychrobacter sp.]